MLTDSTLSGINVFWDLDEMTSAGLIEEFDLNRNNRFEKSEYQKLDKDAFSYAANSGFFTVFTWGEHVLRITSVSHFVAEIRPDSRIRYSFFIPCDLLLTDIAGEKIVLFFNDPSMFVAFELKKKLIQVSTNTLWEGDIHFEIDDYIDLIVLSIKRKPQ
jgi:ABC-type uncharacterized transport system substrate-binding protein